jgi:hypothetical protein
MRDYLARMQLNHSNLIPLLGISYNFGPLPAMVYPWMHNGSLATYLEGHFTELTAETQLQIVSRSSVLLACCIHWTFSCNKCLQPLNTVCGILTPLQKY